MSVSVLEGLDGWLFCEADGPNRPLDHARDLSKWKRDILPLIIANMKARNRRMRVRGLPFMIVLVPDCASIYPENLPGDRRVELPGAAEILCERLLQEGVEALCPSQTLKQAKANFEVFLRHDTHWTVRAAHLCYLQLMRSIGNHLPVKALNDERMRFGLRTGFGDLGIHLRPERSGLIQTVEFPETPVEVRASVNDQHVKSFRHAASPFGSHRLLLFRDSSANALLPFLERSFAETISIAPAPQLLDDAVDRFQPDLVIMCMSESSLFTAEFAFADWDQRTFEQLYLAPSAGDIAADLGIDAMDHLEGGNDIAAIAAAAAAALLSPNPAHIINLAWALLNAEQYEYCRVVARTFADRLADRFLHYLHSSAASHLGDFGESTDALSKALSLQPCNAQYLYSRGELNYQEGFYKDAFSSMERSIEYAPLYERSWVIAISSLLKLGKMQAAELMQREADEIFGVGKIRPET